MVGGRGVDERGEERERWGDGIGFSDGRGGGDGAFDVLGEGTGGLAGRKRTASEQLD
jgi:hypothetical protein